MLSACTAQYEAIPPGQTKFLSIAVGPEPGDSTICLFRVPEGYDPGRPWPLLVALHGSGSDAEPFLDLWQEVASEHGVVLAVPRGNRPGPQGVGRSWGEGAPEAIRRSVDAVRSVVNVDPPRVYLVGFSRGGGLALSLALAHPRAFQGAALLGVPFGPEPQAEIRAASSRAGQRVYIGRGSLEPDPEGARAAAEALRRIGCVVEFNIYEGVGHGLPDPREPELNRILGFLLLRDQP